MSESSDGRSTLAQEFAKRRDQMVGWIRFRIDPRLAGRVDVDDVLQEAFLAAQSRWSHFLAADVDLVVWIRSIVLQTLIDVHRTHLGVKARDVRREVAPPAGDGAASSPSLAGLFVDRISTPSRVAARKEMGLKIQQALEQLSDIDREVLALRHFEMLTNREVAQVLGLTEKTASIRYVRALKRLKPLLEEIEDLADRP